MNRALQQWAGGYCCAASRRDGTAITVTPQGGLSREGGLNRLAQSGVPGKCRFMRKSSQEMGKAAQAEALYAYLTEQTGTLRLPLLQPAW